MVFLLCLCSLPVGALGRVVNENYDFVKQEDFYIGWDSFPVLLRSDASLEYVNGEGDNIALPLASGIERAEGKYSDGIYPVVTQSFSKDRADCRLERFVSLGEDGEALFAYARLEIINSSRKDMDFPFDLSELSYNGVPFEKIASGETVVLDIFKLLKGEETALPLEYDEAKKLMRAHWDEKLEGALSIEGLDKEYGAVYDEYRRDVIFSSIGRTDYSLSHNTCLEGDVCVLGEGIDCYKAARIFLASPAIPIDEGTVAAVCAKANAIISALSSVEFYPGAKLLMRSGGAYLCDNLDALTQLWGCIYLLERASEGEIAIANEYDNILAGANKLAGDIYSCLNYSVSDLSVDFEAMDISGRDKLILSGEGFESAQALCEWYIKNSVFPASASPELSRLAVNAFDYFEKCATADAFISSYICERGDGTLVIGRGAPVDIIGGGASFSVNNFRLSTGEAVSYKVSVDKRNVTVELFCEKNVAVQLEFRAFKNNIENASCGYDIESGIVTAPEGTQKIKIKLKKEAKALEEDRASAADLERSLALCENITTENCTAVSAKEYENALKEAKKVRGADSELRREATGRLDNARAALSSMISGYEYTTVKEKSPLAGKLSCREIYQKFTLPKEGRVREIFVGGEFLEGISCAVYTLRGDAYTTDVLLCENYGEAAEGGIRFTVDFEAEKDKVYVLCIFSENEDISLDLFESNDNTAHTQDSGETTVYVSAGVFARFLVDQADRSSLDTYYNKCVSANVSDYTKNSRKAFSKSLDKAKKILCTPSVSEKEVNDAYNGLKKAYKGLETYASDEVIEEFPTSSIVLICIVGVLLIGTFASAVVSSKKKNQ